MILGRTLVIAGREHNEPLALATEVPVSIRLRCHIELFKRKIIKVVILMNLLSIFLVKLLYRFQEMTFLEKIKDFFNIFERESADFKVFKKIVP